MDQNKKAILTVSFGTSYEETRRKTIDRIEEDIRVCCPDFLHYQAWTSPRIRKKLLERDGIRISSITDAMEAMKRDGVSEVTVQPTYVIPGIENDRMKEELSAWKKEFSRISVGAPLLDSGEDIRRAAEAMAEAAGPKETEALIFMGHGTEHHANEVYLELEEQFRKLGYPNIFMGTVEAEPSVDCLVKKMKERPYKTVILSPFMVVAGDHALNDLAGAEEESWKSIFEREGFDVSCLLKGLGEYPEIRRIFCSHLEEALAGNRVF